MTPSPLNKKKFQLSQNVVLVLTCLLASVGILSYLFWPKEQQWADRTQQSAAEQSDEETPEERRRREEAEAEANTPTRDKGDLTEEEIAKLPAWEAGFARLPREKRLIFATAFSKAKQAYSRAQWAVCLSLLNDCELIYSNSPNIWNLRTCALLESHAYDEAEVYIKRSLQLNPQDTVAQLNQADLLMLRRDYRECIPVLEQLCATFSQQQQMHDIFAFRMLLCHLMLRHEMEARSIVAGIDAMRDSPLYYFAEAAFCIYKGDSNGALKPIRSATTIYGSGGATSSYRLWLDRCGLREKYIDSRRGN